MKKFLLMISLVTLFFASCDLTPEPTEPEDPPTPTTQVNEFTISFDVNKSVNTEYTGEEPAVLTVKEGEALTAEQLISLEPTATFMFAYWQDEDQQIDPGYIVTKDLTLTAKWVSQYTDESSHDTYAATRIIPAGWIKKIVITRPFEISQHEVTQGQWKQIFTGENENPSYFDGSEGKEAATEENQNNRPVDNVSWYAAIAYCNKLSIKSSRKPCYQIEGVDFATLSFSDIPTENNEVWNAVTCDFTVNGFRLPTNAEWEVAARAGDSNNGWAGTSDINQVKDYAWYAANSLDKTHEVMKKKPNAYWLYDMTGNVAEWCWDLDKSITNHRIQRGGEYNCIHNKLDFISFNAAAMSLPFNRSKSTGFRVVATVVEWPFI